MEKLAEKYTYQKLLSIFIEKKGFFHKDLLIKHDPNKGFGIFAKKKIFAGEILIDVPHNLLIPVDEIKVLNNYKNKFSEIYIETMLANSGYLDNHPYYSNNFEQDKITSVIKSNNFRTKLVEFNKLSEEIKKRLLLSYTRSIHLNDKAYFMPILDLVNYNYDGLKYQDGNNGNVFIESEKNIKENEEICVNYVQETDAIAFFFKLGFIDDSLNSFMIKKNQIKLKFNTVSSFDKNYFVQDKDFIIFKKDIHFNHNKVSKSYYKLLEVFPINQRLEKILKILDVYKNSISEYKVLDSEKDSIILKNFYKSVELYKKIIDNYKKIIEKKKDEKN